MDKSAMNIEQDANFYYTYGDMGMKNNGSFTKEKRHWMTFTRETAARMVAQNVKPYGATRRGVFTGTVSGERFKEPAQGVKEAQSSIKTSASWVIREKATGNVILETFDKAKVDALNTVRYEAVPIIEYLASLNKAHQDQEQETKLNLNLTKEDSELIDRIVDRAGAHFPSINRLNLTMDLTATHGGCCPLDLKGLLEAGTADFNHDIAGIIKHINRQTFELEDCFCPRHAAKQEDGDEEHKSMRVTG